MQYLPYLEEYGPEILNLGGTAAQLYANNEKSNAQRAILNQQLARNNQTTKQAVQMIEDQGQQLSPAARLQAMAQAERANVAQTQSDLGAGGASIATAAPGGTVSDDFIKTRAARAIEEGNRLTAMARESARARAPGMVSQNSSLGMANLSNTLNSMYGSNRNMSEASNLSAEGVPDSMVGNLGKVASAIGTGMGMRRGAAQRVPPNPYASGINFGG